MNRRTFLGTLAAAVASPLLPPALPRAISPIEQAMPVVGQLRPIPDWWYRGIPIHVSSNMPVNQVMFYSPRQIGIITDIEDPNA